MNNTINTLLNHRSFRSYQDKPVDEQQLDTIVQAIQSAPSWINGQHVTVIAVKDADRKKIFAELCGGQKHVAEAPVFLIFCADFYRAYVASQKEGLSLEVTDNIDTLLVGATDVGIGLEAAVTAAESLGLGTVAIGGIRRNLEAVIKELNLPPYVIPISGLCIGHPEVDPGLKPRLPKEAVYHSETYNHDIEQHLETYNDTYSEYANQRSGGKTATWTQAVANFYSKPYYHGIEQALKKQKFISNKR